MPSDEAMTQRAGRLQAMTGLIQHAFEALLPFEHALAAYLQDRTIAGKPRTSRRYRPYAHGPLATIADTLLCILEHLKRNPSQEVQGHLLGMSQSNTDK